MKTFSLLLFLTALALNLPGQTNSFAVIVAANGVDYRLNGPDSSGYYERGSSYVIKGYILPGDYIDNNCPTTLNCGILANGMPEDTTVVIGDWDCRGFFTLGFNYMAENGGVFDNSIQTFHFNEKFDDCPGCVITTEGPAAATAFAGTDDNVFGYRTIAGGTKGFKNIRGDDYNVGYFHLPEWNPSGSVNAKHIFTYEVEEDNATYNMGLDVSVNGLSLNWGMPNDTSSQFGSTLSLEGMIYPAGTFATNGSNSGMDASGNPEFSPIGKWTCRGWWYSEEYDFDPSVGLFTITQQTFEFDDPNLGHLQIMTEGRDFTTLNVPVEKIVVGATDALAGHRGNCMETQVGLNASNGFNFTYSFETQQVTALEEEPLKKSQLLLTLYPNPVSSNLNLLVGNLESKGEYQFQIFDVTGRLILEKEFQPTGNFFEDRLDFSTFPAGWYGIVLKRSGVVVGSKGFSKINK